MAGQSTATVFGWRRARLWGSLLAAVVPTVLIAAVAVILGPGPYWLLPIVLVAFAFRVVTATVGFRSGIRQSWAVRIDGDGIDWVTGRHLDWRQVVEVRTYRHRPLTKVVRLFGQTPDDEVIFVSRAQADFVRRARSVPTGPTLSTSVLDATLEQILAVVRSNSTVPIVER